MAKGDRPPGLTIDRVDCDGPYSKGNCRWASMKEQNNNRRNNRRFTYQGRTQTLQQWSEELGVNRATLSQRINRRLSLDEAFNFERRFRSKGH